MASKKIHTVPFRRKRDNKTDYKSRLGLLKSGKTRFVVRTSLKNTIVQIVDFSPSGDKVLATLNTDSLKAFGWKHSRSNTPSAYLLGLMVGKKAAEIGKEEGVLDTGLQTLKKGGKIFAVLKGMVDAGIDIPHSEDKDIFPSQDRIKGKHIADFKKSGIDKDFEDVKKKILA